VKVMTQRSNSLCTSLPLLELLAEKMPQQCENSKCYLRITESWCGVDVDKSRREGTILKEMRVIIQSCRMVLCISLTVIELLVGEMQ
jgi:hypothetical protein